jgi:predicted esterase
MTPSKRRAGLYPSTVALLALSIATFSLISNAGSVQKGKNATSTVREVLKPPGKKNIKEIAVYKPSSSKKAKPMVMMLHGMCGMPTRTCSYIDKAGTKHGWLVCPKAQAQCPSGGGSIWFGDTKHTTKTIDETLSVLQTTYPHQIDNNHSILVGFSQGAYVASLEAMSGKHSWKGVILLASSVNLSPTKLREAGIQRVLLAAGDLDQTARSMKTTTRYLQKNGIEATYWSLGNIGHTFPKNFNAWLSRAIEWADTGKTTAQEPKPQGLRTATRLKIISKKPTTTSLTAFAFPSTKLPCPLMRITKDDQSSPT